MADPSEGFCDYVSATLFAPGAGTSYEAPPGGAAMAGSTTQLSPAWQEPSLQIIDIQATPLYEQAGRTGDDDIEDDVADARVVREWLFYVLLSDGKKVMWGVAPPGSGIATLIGDREIEAGCMATLHDYAAVPARNGHPVLVLIDVSFDPVKLSAIGPPAIDKALFRLSPQAVTMPLVSRGPSSRLASRRASEARSVVDPAALRQVTLRELWASAGDGLDAGGPPTTWRVAVRVIWKSRVRRFNPRGRDRDAAPTQLQRPQASQGEKFVFDCRVVDAEGSGANAVFWGSRQRFEEVVQGCVAVLGRGALKRRQQAPESTGVGGSDHPVMTTTVEFGDRSVCIVAPPGSEAGAVAARRDADAADGGHQQEGHDDSDDTLMRLLPATPLPHRITHDLCPLEREFVDVPLLALSSNAAEVGAVVSVAGVVLRTTQATSVQTRRGRVDRKHVVLAPLSALASAAAALTTTTTVNVTLWGEHAGLPLAPRTAWCFRRLKVGMFGNDRVLSSLSSSEIVPRDALLALPGGGTPVAAGPTQQQHPSSLLSLPSAPGHHRPSVPVVHPGSLRPRDDAQAVDHLGAPQPPPARGYPLAQPNSSPAVPMSGTSGLGGSAVPSAAAAVAPAAASPMAVPLAPSLAAAIASTRTLHHQQPLQGVTDRVMVRLVYVQPPMHRMACSNCGLDPTLPPLQPRACRRDPACHAVPAVVAYDVRAKISDGVDAVDVNIRGDAAEALAGCSAAEFDAGAAADGTFVARVVNDVVAMPIVVRLRLRTAGVAHPRDDGAGDDAAGRLVVDSLELTDFSVMATHLATELQRRLVSA